MHRSTVVVSVHAGRAARRRFPGTLRGAVEAEAVKLAGIARASWALIDSVWTSISEAASRRLLVWIDAINAFGEVYAKWLVRIVSNAVFVVKAVIEVFKLVCNAYIDGQVALANTVANLARSMWEVEEE